MFSTAEPCRFSPIAPSHVIEPLVRFCISNDVAQPQFTLQDDNLFSQYRLLARNVATLLVKNVNGADSIKKYFGDLLFYLYEQIRNDIYSLSYTDFRLKAPHLSLPEDEAENFVGLEDLTKEIRELRFQKYSKKRVVNVELVKLMFGDLLDRDIRTYADHLFSIDMRPSLSRCPQLTLLDCLLSRLNLLPRQIKIETLMRPCIYSSMKKEYQEELNVFLAETDHSIIFCPKDNTINITYNIHYGINRYTSSMKTTELKERSANPLKFISSEITGCHLVIIRCRNSGNIYFSHVSPASLSDSSFNRQYRFAMSQPQDSYAYNVFSQIPAEEKVDIIVVDQHGFYDEVKLKGTLKCGIASIKQCSFPAAKSYFCAFTPSDTTVHFHDYSHDNHEGKYLQETQVFPTDPLSLNKAWSPRLSFNNTKLESPNDYDLDQPQEQATRSVVG